MKGCRPLTDPEADLIVESFDGKYAARNRAIFNLELYTGERISAILKLRIGDVVQSGKILEHITYRRQNRKGKIEGRTVRLHPVAKAAVFEWINQLAAGTILTSSDYLFRSRKGPNRPISRVCFHRILQDAVQKNGFVGKVATHSMRKTFADRVHKALGNDLFRTQKALGHKNINSTVQYLSYKEADIEEAILKM